MSPQQIMLLRRHASSAAALLERKDTTDKPSNVVNNLPTIRGAGQHSVKKRPPPARPPLPARLRSISHQPLPGQLSEFRAELIRNVKTDRGYQVYVSSTSRICLANSLDGLVEKVAPKLDGCRPPAPLPPRTANIQTMRNVTVGDTVEMQSVACWLEGSFLFPPHFLQRHHHHYYLPNSVVTKKMKMANSEEILSPSSGGSLSLYP